MGKRLKWRSVCRYIDPANEHAHQHLMFCHVASGNRPAASRQYELCVRALEEDLDAPPLPENDRLLINGSNNMTVRNHHPLVKSRTFPSR